MAPIFFVSFTFARHCCKLYVRDYCYISLYAISRKTNEPNLRKWHKKKLISGPILSCLAQIWASLIFFVSFTSTRCYTLLQAIIVAISRKTNNQNSRKWQKNLSGRKFGLSIYFQKDGFVSLSKLWSAFIMFNIRKK